MNVSSQIFRTKNLWTALQIVVSHAWCPVDRHKLVVRYFPMRRTAVALPGLFGRRYLLIGRPWGRRKQHRPHLSVVSLPVDELLGLLWHEMGHFQQYRRWGCLTPFYLVPYLLSSFYQRMIELDADRFAIVAGYGEQLWALRLRHELKTPIPDNVSYVQWYREIYQSPMQIKRWKDDWNTTWEDFDIDEEDEEL